MLERVETFNIPPGGFLLACDDVPCWGVGNLIFVCMQSGEEFKPGLSFGVAEYTWVFSCLVGIEKF